MSDSPWDRKQEGRLGDEQPATAKARPPGRPPRSTSRADSHVDDRLAGEREGDEREITEDRELSDDERLELFRDSMQQSVLPNLPNFPGHHTFWATTTNPRDSIQRRMMLGYKPIRIEEFPGWDGTGVKMAGIEGVVAINEMVAMRIPTSLYQRYMLEAHHNQPLQEEEKIRSIIDSATAGTGRDQWREEGDGTEQLVQRTKAPNFAP